MHFNVDYIFGISEYKRIEIPDIDIGNDQPKSVLFNETRDAVFNFGVGAEIYMSEMFTAYLGLSSDYTAYGSNANIFDLSSPKTKDINVGEDFFHFSAGVNWTLKWASFVLGTTYTSGSSTFDNPLFIPNNGTDLIETDTSRIDYNRWQFVIGVEVPFLDNFNKNITD